MVGASSEGCQLINNLDVTVIELEPARDQSLAKDVIEVITGVSSNAITVGGKITAGTIIYTGHESIESTIANKIFWGASLAAIILDFLMTPLGYLYKLYKKEKVPFNLENNIKWALSGVTLALAIVSVAVVASASTISFINAGIAIVVGIASLWKYFYDYRITAELFRASQDEIASITDHIESEMEEINNLQDQIQLIHHTYPGNHALLNPFVIQLAQTYRRYYAHCDELKDAYNLKNSLERRYIRQKSPIELIGNIIKFSLAGIVLAGTILSFFNPIAGMIMLGVAAVCSLLTIIGKKTVQIIQKRVERENEKKRNLRIEIPLTTTKIMKSLQVDSHHNIDLQAQPTDSPQDVSTITQAPVDVVRPVCNPTLAKF